MFTSKKAQYLTNNFEHISPITNIDSLYFEKITKNGEYGYKINRQSVVKNMPIQCDALLYEYRKKYQSMYNYTNIHNDITNIDVNINTLKNTLHNPYDNVLNKFLYDTSLYEISSPGILDLTKILVHYEPSYKFYIDTSTRLEHLEYLNTSINNASAELQNFQYITHNTSEEVRKNQHIHSVYYHDVLLNQNESYFTTPKIYVTVQDVSLNDHELNTISLNNITIQPSFATFDYINDWSYVYDPNLNEITYLKDEFGNEATFDFRNLNLDDLKIERQKHSTFYAKYIEYSGGVYTNPYNYDILRELKINSNIPLCTIRNNKIFTKLGDVTFKFHDNFGRSTNNEQITVSNNEFIRSSNLRVVIDGMYSECISNKVINSTNVTLYVDKSNFSFVHNNTVLNSSNYKLTIQGSNNTIINCNDSSITILGNNNFISNVKNASVVIGDNTVFINNSSYNLLNDNIIVNNCNLLLDDSLSMINKHNDIATNSTILGSNINKINVYYDSINTIK